LEITEEGAPELFEACKVAVDKRLVIGLNSQTGWSMAHMANIYARLGMGERSLECLEILLRSSTGANFFTYHNDWRHMGLSSGGRTMPPFQIDANMGFSSAVLEMLGYSRVGQLKLLPALPESWTRGSIKGLRARGGLVVNMSWDRQQGRLELEVTTDEDQELELFWPSWVKSVDLKSGGLIQGEKSNSGILKFNKG
jgi:alpha-L-fucosidase 2